MSLADRYRNSPMFKSGSVGRKTSVLFFIDKDGTRDAMTQVFADALKAALIQNFGPQTRMMLLTRDECTPAAQMLGDYPELDGVAICDERGFSREIVYRKPETAAELKAGKHLSVLLDDTPDQKKLALMKTCQKIGIPEPVVNKPIIDYTRHGHNVPMIVAMTAAAVSDPEKYFEV